jgi:hypothetical protein
VGEDRRAWSSRQGESRNVIHVTLDGANRSFHAINERSETIDDYPDTP